MEMKQISLKQTISLNQTLQEHMKVKQGDGCCK